MQRKLTFAIIILSIGLLFITTEHSNAATYAFMIDRFEIVGNSPVHFVDEFDDGTLGGEWFQFRPTVIESNGQLILSSPGQSNLGNLGNLIVQEEATAIESFHPGPLSVQDGAGDFSGISTWLPVLPGVNQMFWMEAFHHIDQDTTESISIGVSNFESSIADALGFSTTGMGMFFLQQNPDGDLFVQSTSLDPADVTGNILLQLSFSDNDDLFAGSYSLNGGQAFQGLFTALSPETMEGDFKWGMHALSLEPVPIPSAVWLLGSGLLGMIGIRRKVKI
jgi:hypothetical protein